MAGRAAGLDYCMHAPALSRVEIPCSTTQIHAANPDYWEEKIVPILEDKGINNANKAQIPVCGLYTGGNKNCAYVCSLKGMSCAGAIETEGPGSLKKPKNHCQELPSNKYKKNFDRKCDGGYKGKLSQLCICRPFEPDCYYLKPRGENCSSSGDPHVIPFYQFSGINPNVGYGLPFFDYMQTGEHRLVRARYEGETHLEVHARQTAHLILPEIATNKGVAFAGKVTCGHKLEVIASRRDKNWIENDLIKEWGRLKSFDFSNAVYDPEVTPKFIIDGNIVGSTPTEFIDAIKALKCSSICGFKTYLKDKPADFFKERFKIEFHEGTSIMIGSYKSPRYGLQIRIFLSAHIAASTATGLIMGESVGVKKEDHKDGGVCYSSIEQHVPCPSGFTSKLGDESLFSEASYPDGESCGEYQPDPERPDFLPNPMDKCEKDLPKFFAEAKKVCRKACPEEVVPTCIYDACLFENLDGSTEVREQCETDEEEQKVTRPLPTPQPTHPCDPLLGVKFKYNKDKHFDTGKKAVGGPDVRVKADMTFKKDVWDNVYKHNHGPRHLQKKFYHTRIGDPMCLTEPYPECSGYQDPPLTDGEVACLCWEYCSQIGAAWFQSNLKRRPAQFKKGVQTQMSRRYGKCQCYLGEPIFKKTRLTYATGACSDWAHKWLHGNGVKSTATNLIGVGVTYDVPETRKKVETKENPHVFLGPNDMEVREIHTKALRHTKKGKNTVKKRWSPNIPKGGFYSGAHSFKNFGSPHELWVKDIFGEPALP